MMCKPTNPLSPQEQTEVMFLLALLEDQFGGTPSLGIGEDGSYVVVPTCMCSVCCDFRKTYTVKPKKSILAAAKAYGDDKLCQLTTREHMESGRTAH